MRKAEQPRRVNQSKWVSGYSPEDNKTCLLHMHTKVPTRFSQGKARTAVFNSLSFAYLLGGGKQRWAQTMQEAKRQGIIDIPGPMVYSAACWSCRLGGDRVGESQFLLVILGTMMCIFWD